MLIAAVRNTIRRHSMLVKGSRVLVAVSGGPDSVCLLSVLHALAAESGIELHAAHLDHRFRGDESAEDALFVRRLAGSLSVSVSTEAIDVPAYCRERGRSAQEGAREVRYAFLERIAKAIGASLIATGHTADDQAETLLMRLIRGAGSTGMSGIPPRRGSIIRPLIDVTRDEVLRYLEKAGLSYRSDSSNAEPVYQRNRMRLEVLPVLRAFNPRITETLAREAALFRDEDDALRDHIDHCLSTLCTRQDKGVIIDRTGFSPLLPGIKRRVVKQVVNMAGADATRLTYVRIEEALAFLSDAQTGRAMDLGFGLTLTREYDRFIVSELNEPGPVSRNLAVPGITAAPEFGLDFETSQGTADADSRAGQNYLWQATFDYDKICAPLIVRNRQPGDQFCPAGMGGKHKKLQDFFVDEKIPQRDRSRIPVVCTGSDIVWIVGHRTDERFIAKQGAVRTLTIRIQAHGAPECEV
jgi:tRNA(Ile)-lysidine synthase